jgi:hypothetical protein
VNEIPKEFENETGLICDGIDENGNSCDIIDPQSSTEGCAMCFKCKYCLCHKCIDTVTIHSII